MTSNALQPRHRGSRRALALVRLALSWLLVAVLAVDLVTSPLHAHRHNGEWSAGGALGVLPAHASGMHGPVSAVGASHVDHDDAPRFSHSIVALRAPVEVKADVQPLDDTPAAVPRYLPAPWSLSEAETLAWLPDRHRAGASAFRSLPPNGRAPPLRA